MISPYVRRLRLATEVRALRAGAGLTADQLGKRIGRSRADISRLENGHVVDQADIIAILDAVGVDGDRWTQIVTIAREAGERGWWESNKTMGDRQALYANLEAGAASICEYQQTFVPGLLQTPEFVRARAAADVTLTLVTRGLRAQGEDAEPRLRVVHGASAGTELVLAEASRTYAIGKSPGGDLVVDAVALVARVDALR